MTCLRSMLPLAIAALASLASLPSPALTNPPIRVAQGIEYMCGGQDGSEASFMRTVAPRWAAALQFGVSHGAADRLPAAVHVQLRERYTGRSVMEADTASPFLLARLDPGAYDIEATMGGVTLMQPLVVFNGFSTHAAFVWPSNLDFPSIAAGRDGARGEQQAAMRSGTD